MESYKCLVVDDEKLAQELLENYIKKIPYLELTAACSTAIKAIQQLKQEPVDIMFLDIQMPDFSGTALLRTLNNPPATIFTTAYSEYALEGYELSIVDYLLKPIAFERFIKATTKAIEHVNKKQKIALPPAEPEAKSNGNYFFIKSENKIVKVIFDDILFIEALQKYIRIYTSKGKIITLLSLSKIQESLPKNQFIRIHRSYIINLDKIESIEGNLVRIKEYKIPISKGQKEQFMMQIKNKGLF